MSDPAAAARGFYQRFHGQGPGHSVRLELPEIPAHGSALGQVDELTYSEPEGMPSAKAGARWRHRFGDTGHGDTGARPYLVDIGRPGVLLIVSKPDEETFHVDDYIRG